MSDVQYDPKIISPSVVTAWLACPHSLTLRLNGKGKPNSARHFGNFAQLIMDRGNQHEVNCLESLHEEFSSEEILELIKASDKESFQQFYDRVEVPEPSDYKVVYQAPLIFDGMRGIADFLVSVDSKGNPLPTFMPVDAKLARNAAKPGHVLQLCFYADAIESRTGIRPEKVEIWLGKDGRTNPEVIYLRDVDAYWNRSKKKLKAILEADVPPETEAVPCSHCTFCVYQETCETEWKRSDSLFYVAGATKQDREKLVSTGVNTRADLAIRTKPVDKLSPKRLTKLQKQAAAQVKSRASLTDDFVPSPLTHVEIFPKPAEIIEPFGFELLPPADPGDIFLDYEGHPFWTIQEGLIFLFGYWSSDDNGKTWRFTAMWAHDKQDEQIAGEQLVKFITARQRQYPNMHVYHYNHTERSSLASLLVEQADTLDRFRELVEKNIFIDIYQIIRQGLIIGVESYGLKNIEKIAGFSRQLPESAATKGADAVVEYEGYMNTEDPLSAEAQQHLLNIALYNQGDVEATQAVRDWLLQLRATHYPKMPWPLPAVALQPKVIDPVVAQLLTSPLGTPENLLGHVCGFWDRENSAAFAALNVLLDTDPDDHLAHLRILADLEFVRFVDEPPKKKTEGSDEEDAEESAVSMVLSFETQEADSELQDGSGSVAFRDALGDICYASLKVHRIDNEIKIDWKYERDSSLAPRFLVKSDKYREDKKRAALAAIASLAVSSAGLRSIPATEALLSRQKIDVVKKCLGKYKKFPTDVHSLTEILKEMNGEVLPIQGPPGTGKTFTGAALIVNLFRTMPNIRIGLATFGHSACNNLVAAIKNVGLTQAELAKVLRSPPSNRTGIAGIRISNPSPELKIPRPFWSKDFQIFAGVVSPFCEPEFTQPEFQLDYLFIDEAGQMSLADAVAISRAAKNIILLGDPLQLPQVVQATHLEGSGRSVLEHFLGDREIVQTTEGVFLDTSYRMHPEICQYISERIYQGKLKPFAQCGKQNVDGEFGLSIQLMNHLDRSSVSLEEVNKVAELVNHYLGKPWTDRTDDVPGQRTIEEKDILIVAPYNLQRRAIESKLKELGVEQIQVGTVDKFQGREAAIVIFSMAASSADDVPRGARFLFDRNRLNVAVSRAKCLAIIVCNEPLLDTVAKDIDQMKSISALCAFEASAKHL